MSANEDGTKTSSDPNGVMPGASPVPMSTYRNLKHIADSMTGGPNTPADAPESTPDPQNIQATPSASNIDSDSEQETIQRADSASSIIRASENTRSRLIGLLEQCADPLDSEIIDCLEDLCEYSDDGSQSLLRKYELVVCRFKEDFVQLSITICDSIRISIDSLHIALDAALIGYNAAAAKRCNEVFTNLGVMAAEFKVILDSYVGQAQDFSTTVDHAAITWNRVSSSMSDFAAAVDNKVLACSQPVASKHVRSLSPLSRTSKSSTARYINIPADFVPGYRYKCSLGTLKLLDDSMSFVPSIAAGSQISAVIISGLSIDLIKKLLLKDVIELANHISHVDPGMEKFKASGLDYRRKFMNELTKTVPTGHHQWTSVGPVETVSSAQ